MKNIFKFLILLSVSLECLSDCELFKPKDSSDRKKETALLETIRPLKQYTFRTKDAIDPAHYDYTITICGKIEGQGSGVGAIQVTPNETHILGRCDMVDIMGGNGWILLTYYGGHAYHTHCNNSDRVTKIMIICNPDVLAGELEILEERKSNPSSCYYLFELGSNVTCNFKKKIEAYSLSSGSVFCILFFTGISLYLVLGFLYKRIVMGAQGLEQIPNYSFWRDFGNLQADGCDYFCRWGPRQESHAYRGIDDHLKMDEERDDQLLNM